MSTQVKEPLTPDVYDKYASPKVDDLEAEQPEVKSASVLWLLLISMPRMAIQMAWAAQWAALGPYLGTMLPRFAVQITQIIGPLSGILVAPTVGVLSDRSTHPWGRRRPFLAYAAVFSAICWILMGYTREMGEALGDYGNGKPGVPTSRKWTATFTIFFYIWMDVTVNVVQTPAQLLVADLAGDRQTTGAALMQAWGALGSFLISGYIQVFGAAYLSLHTFMAMLACVMLGSVGVVCFFVKETPLDKNQVEQTSAWRGVANAFYSIYEGVRTLPGVLVVYCFIIFCVKYGYTAYNGNKGQFFGLEVYGGESSGADKCGNNCTAEQTAYSHGVRVAGGSTDLMFNAVGYIYSWTLPLLVRQFGVKWTLTVSMLPQCCLIIMAFTKVVAVNVFIVVITSTTQNVILTLIVPILIHVMGHQAEIGMYVGALNSANCFGQLLNFAIGAAIVQTPMGYKLPVLLGGIMTVVGVVVSIFFFKIKMNSL